MKRASDELVKDGGTVPPSTDGDSVIEGFDAWGRLKKSCQQTWSDWLLVGAALLIGRREAMRIACSNAPSGGRYRAAFTYWLTENGFADLEKRTRADLLRIMECLDEVEVWRSGLKKDHRLRVNHPSTTWRACSASKKGVTPRRSSRADQYEEDVRRLQEENDMLRGRFDRVLASAVDRAKLAKILGMLGSSQDGEVLNAARMAEDMRQQANLTWEDLLGVT
jgi:hypothetical protein